MGEVLTTHLKLTRRFSRLFSSRQTWKVGLIFSAFLVFITSMPQLYLCLVRGSEWKGSSAYLDTDEFSYAAYVNALIDGRPRRNDPYSGKDQSEYDNLYSIQFLPAYAVAVPARLLDVSASTVFIVLVPLAALLSMIALLWLLLELTDNPYLAGVGAIGVLCLGTIAAFDPVEIATGLQRAIPFFPFARRYVPALPFPLFLITAVFVWRSLTRNAAWAVLAGIGFSGLVFSYFFLWTAAAVWFFTVLALWFIARPEDRKRVWQVAAVLGSIGVCALLPYLFLLMNRAKAIDQSHLLDLTRAPDLFRPPELYAALLIGALLFLWRGGKIEIRNPKVLFTASFLVAPFLIFNQQVVTGRSLQPFHYAEFVTNYWVVLSAFLTLSLIVHTLPRRILVYAAVIGLFFGVVLGVRASRITLGMNVHLDEARGLVTRLRSDNQPGVVLTSDLLLSNAVAMNTTNPVLWARHLFTFSNVDVLEQKRRFYHYLYYLGIDQSEFTSALRDDFVARWEVFGARRANPGLALIGTQISEEEILSAAKEYEQLIRGFDSTVAAKPQLTYAVVSSSADLSNLDRWYEREVVEKSEKFVLYRLKFRSSH